MYVLGKKVGREEMIVLVLCVLHLVINLIWLKVDSTPPGWDQAAHLSRVFAWRDVFLGQRTVAETLNMSFGYPPLMYMIGGGLSLILGLQIDGVSFLNSLFFAILLWVFYKCSKNFVATLLFSLVSILVAYSRSFTLDIPLSLWVTLGFYFWIKSRDFADIKYTTLWHLMLVLSALTKLNGFMYFIPMFGYSLWLHKRDVWPIVKHQFIGLTFYIPLFFWWIVNMQNNILYITGLAGQGEVATDPMNLLSIFTWIHYIKLFFVNEGGFTLALTVFATILFFLPKNNIVKRILIVLGVNYIFLCVIKNKDFRFALPILPLLFWLFAISLEQIKDRWLIKVMLGVGVLVSIGLFVNNTFGWPIAKPFFKSVPSYIFGGYDGAVLDFVSISDYPIRTPRQAYWYQKEIVQDVVGDMNQTGVSKKQKLLTAINIEELNDNNLYLYRDILMARQFFDIHSPDLLSGYTSDEVVVKRVAEFDYVLLMDKSLPPAPYYVVNLKAYEQVRDFVLDNPSLFEIMANYKLPNGSELFLYKKLASTN